MYVYYYRTYEKAVNEGGGWREKGRHVLRDTLSPVMIVLFTVLSSLRNKHSNHEYSVTCRRQQQAKS